MPTNTIDTIPMVNTLPQGIEVERGIFCNRTLNLRTIKAIGYDMDYTLVHYNVDAWEGRAYKYLKEKFLQKGWPVKSLKLDPEMVIRGLVIDKELGNIIKANRFGYIKKASHGTLAMEFSQMRKTYSRTLVDLAESRYYFLNTLFSISEGCFYAQLVDLLDAGELPETLGYRDLFDLVRKALDSAHVEGELKAEIMANPKRYVELDPEMPKALLDQRDAGKKLLLITNSEWSYTKFMMEYACDPFLPRGMNWRELFHLVVVSARKPDFFTGTAYIFKVINDEGLLQPHVGAPKESGIYLGGNSKLVESFLGLSGDEILYVGDHLFSDVSVSKSISSWRTALIIRELEQELMAIEFGRMQQAQIREYMWEKEDLENLYNQMRLVLQKHDNKRIRKHKKSIVKLKKDMEQLKEKIRLLDEKLTPMVSEAGHHLNVNWGYMMRAGNDKSHMTRQIEKYADIYTSRVSNLLKYTPFAFFRSPRGSIPHDPIRRLM